MEVSYLHLELSERQEHGLHMPVLSEVGVLVSMLTEGPLPCPGSAQLIGSGALFGLVFKGHLL